MGERLAGGTYYYLFDGLGSVVALTDATGKLVNRYAYDPYGNPIASGTSGSVADPWRFAGGYLDAATGLYKFGTRYYEPATGRWTQPHPSGLDAKPTCTPVPTRSTSWIPAASKARSASALKRR